MNICIFISERNLIMKKLRRVLAVCLVLAITVLVLPTDFYEFDADAAAIWNGSVAGSFAGGNGTSSTPYIISTGEQLARLSKLVNDGNASFVSAYFVLNADIRLNDVSQYDKWHSPEGTNAGGEATTSDEDWFGTETGNGSVTPARNWTPIGSSAHPFNGNFNGNGHCISGLYCSSESGYAGLFGKNTGTVSNVSTIKSYVISSGNYAGGIIGYNSGTVSKIANAGKVSSTKNFVGGLIGYNTGSVSDGASYGSVTGKDNVGGCIGAHYGTNTATRLLATGSVKGVSADGAVVGFSENVSKVTSSYYKSTIGATDESATSKTDSVLKNGTAFSGWSNWTFTSGKYPEITGLRLEISHTFSNSWSSDATNHWHACIDADCTETSGLAAHSGGTATCSAKAVCSVCGTSYGNYGAHNPTHYNRVEATHTAPGNIEYWYCATCGKYFSNSTCTTQITQAQTVISQIPHSFSNVWSKDATKHWHECSCGAIDGEATHSFTNDCDADCNVCGYIRTITHNYQWVKDESGHKQVCSVCGDTINEGTHTYSSAFDTNCDDCGYERQLGTVSGTCGDGVTYEYNTVSGAVIISGEGEITQTPWNERATGIKSVTISEKITSVPSGAFSGCTALKTVYVYGNPEIAANAFTGCTGAEFYGWHYTDIYDFCGENSYKFTGLESFEITHFQTNTNEPTKFRVIAEMVHTEKYNTAGFEITLNGTDGAGHDFNNSFQEKTIKTVYKLLHATDKNGKDITLGAEQEDGYLSALIMNGPGNAAMGSDAKLVFAFTPYVTNIYSGEKIYFDTIKFVYEKGESAPVIRLYDPAIDEKIPFHADDGEGEGEIIDWNDM